VISFIKLATEGIIARVVTITSDGTMWKKVKNRMQPPIVYLVDILPTDMHRSIFDIVSTKSHESWYQETQAVHAPTNIFQQQVSSTPSGVGGVHHRDPWAGM
jgi:hypothetical protein